MEYQEERAAKQLWNAGYMISPGTGRDVLLLTSQGGKVAFATPRLSDGRWAVRELTGCLSFGGSSIVADAPCAGFLRLLGMKPIAEHEDVGGLAAEEDPAQKEREELALSQLSENPAYSTGQSSRPGGLRDMWCLFENGEYIAFAEPMPDGRWRSKKTGTMRAMLGDANAVYDSGPFAALCRTMGRPLP